MMNEPLSYWRLAIVSIVAIAFWCLATFVPSPYEQDAALVPTGPAHETSLSQPLSDVPLPAAAHDLA